MSYQYIDFKEADVIKAFAEFQKRVGESGTPMALCDMSRIRVKLPDSKKSECNERILYVCTKDIFDSVAPKILRYPTPNIDWFAEKYYLDAPNESTSKDISNWHIDMQLRFSNIPVVNPPWLYAHTPERVGNEYDGDDYADIRARIIVDIRVSDLSERYKNCPSVIDNAVKFSVSERLASDKNYHAIRKAHVDWFGPFDELGIKRALYNAVAKFLREHNYAGPKYRWIDN